MIENPSASVTMSLRQSHIDKIKEFRKKHSKKYRSEAAVVQHIIDSFFSKGKHRAINYIAYPIIIMVLMLYAGISTAKLNGILLEKGLYFNELYIQYNIFYIIGFAWLGITIASFVWYLSKRE